jgi:hypothetical protein
MFIAEYDPTTTHSFLIARPISGSGTAGAAIPISDDVGTAQFVVAAADAAGTATVAWTDDLETDTALVARLPFGATSVTPTPLFPGHETRSLQLATTKFGDVAITGTLDYYGATTSAGLQYWKNPPACEAASASTGFGASVGISLKCASRNTPSSFDIQTAPAHGTASVSAAGAASYTPAAGFSGTDSFTYTATNANGVSPGSTVTVDVAAAPVPPIVKIKKSAKFPKGKIKANRKIKVALTGVDPGKKITIAWRLKKKTAKGGAISTDRSYVTFKSPKKKGKYKVTIKLGSEVLFSGRVKVS